MAYVVRVDGKNGKTRFADKLGGGTEFATDAQIFYNLAQAEEVRAVIQECVGKNAHAFLVVLP